ncbi:DUF2935 domain-containing protein [Bacillus sp. HMF5848]|nr:DUF2935 domain-containing protein [Bacillus sp. HMF5848]
MNPTIRDEALFEAKFWMQVLGDHARFIYDSLAPSETVFIAKAEDFIKSFDILFDTARKSIAQDELKTLLRNGINEANQLRAFKLTILEKQLVDDVAISLPPSFLNHMVNELDEWLRVANSLLEEQSPIAHPLHHDLLWLLDAAGHAGAINDSLDRVEKDLKQKSADYTKQWEDFYLKAVELVGYLRANISQFPALQRFHNDIEVTMKVFKSFLRELEELGFTKKSLGTLTPLMADHMAREECYYLTKLAQTTDVVSQPKCDPTKPRTEL